MPRPGPRPYECVRRAWHSDRQNPVRGSLIKEIFRMVNEVHNSDTRKNTEWQEKLPIVVIKAEEIMYSKANSEAEYSDLKTLWDRVSDAIDTIIRKDESTETGIFLQPCIEAALHLGCTARRSSRSQRNESPRCYLKPQNQPSTSTIPPNNPTSKACGNYTNMGPVMLHSSQNLTAQNPINPSFGIQNINQTDQRFTCFPKNFVSGDHNQPESTQPHSVYPLWYNNQIQIPDELKIYPSNPTYNYSPVLQNNTNENVSSSRFEVSNFVFPSNHERLPDNRELMKCDLTLRLGCLDSDI